MKKFKNLLACITSVLLLTGALTGCTDCTDCNLQNQNTSFNLDLANYQIDISDATSIGISRPTKLKQSKTLKAEGHQTSTENTNTLVKTTVDYKDGASNPELDENKNLVGVKFTKILTTETTKTTTGFKNYLSFGATKVSEDKDEYNKDAKIQIAIPKFNKRTENGKPAGDQEFVDYTYSLYDGETLLLDNIKDNDTNDINETVGLIELGNLENNKTYTVKYSGQVEQIDVTQSEIGAEIDKVYVYSPEITIMSFVPEGTSRRPLDNELKMTPDGQSMYDSCDYYSKDEIGEDYERQARQSFICDNKTGNIYKLGNDVNGNPVEIVKIRYGIIYLEHNTFPYILDIINNNLYFRPIHTNPDINMHSCFRDKYGYNYVLNKELDLYDKDTKTYFYTPKYVSVNGDKELPLDAYVYYLTTSRDTIRVPGEFFVSGGFDIRFSIENGCKVLNSGKVIEVQTENGFRKISATDEFTFIKNLSDDKSFYYDLQLLNIKNYALSIIESSLYNTNRFAYCDYFEIRDYIYRKFVLNPVTNIFDLYTEPNRHFDYTYFNAKYINYDVMFNYDENNGTVYGYKDWYKNNFTSHPIELKKGLTIQDGILKKISATRSEIYDVYATKDKETGEVTIDCLPVKESSSPSVEDFTYKFAPINR